VNPIPEVDETKVWLRKLGLAPEGNPAHPFIDCGKLERLHQPLEGDRVRRHQLEDPQLILGPSGG
jgi:hypothetical protein